MTRIAVYGGDFQVPVRAGRPMELGALHGFVVRRAAQHALAVPMSEAVYAILQPWAVRNQGEAQS